MRRDTITTGAVMLLVGVGIGYAIASERFARIATYENEESGESPSSVEAGPAPFSEGDADSGWSRELMSSSGSWISNDPKCSLELDGRVLRFSGENHWRDLNDGLFLLGTTLDFITSDAFYKIDFMDIEKGFLTMVRRERPGFEQWDTVKFRKVVDD